MYLEYWQLNQRPFEETSDPAFYYPNESHQGALLKLRYAVENRRGAALLTGPAGLGKTLLLRSLLGGLPEQCAPRIHLVFPQMPADQLLAYIAAELTGLDCGSSTEGLERAALACRREAEALEITRAPTIANSVRRIATALTANDAAGRHAIVAVDEAQFVADGPTLETLRLLLNFESPAGLSLTLILAGQVALLPALARRPQLEERLAVKCLLRPFSQEETMSYVSHRLDAAGTQRTIFTTEALEALHEHARGVPRRINRLADLALLIGFAEEQQQIGAEQIAALDDELATVAAE